jgi:hypothetical protein
MEANFRLHAIALTRLYEQLETKLARHYRQALT